MSHDLVLLTISLLTWGVGESMFMYFQPLYLQKLGADPVKIGVILGIAAIASVCVHIPAGYLADRIGRRPLIWSSWIIALTATWTMALAKSLPVFVVGMVIYSCTYFVIAPMNSYITAARGKWSAGRAITVLMAAFNFGSILGPLLGGRIADQVGLRSIYFIAGSIFILSTTFVLRIQPQPLDQTPAEADNHSLGLNQRYLTYLGVVFIAMFVAYLPQPLSSNYLNNEMALTFSQIGALGSISSLGMVSLSLVLGRLNPHLALIASQVAVGLFALLLWRGNSFILFCAGYFFLGGFRTAHSMASAQTSELVHRSRMGLAYGFTETIFSLAMTLAPPLAGFLYENRPSLIYSASFVLILVSLVILVFYYYRPRLWIFTRRRGSVEME
jgi:MFS family permease